jgi:hypothetical protein
MKKISNCDGMLAQLCPCAAASRDRTGHFRGSSEALLATLQYAPQASIRLRRLFSDVTAAICLFGFITDELAAVGSQFRPTLSHAAMPQP